MKQQINEIRRFQKLAGLFEGYRNVKDGLDNIFLRNEDILELQQMINGVQDSKVKNALLVYIAALEDGWRHFDDDVDPRNPDYDDVWHNLEYGNAMVDGKKVSYDDAEKTLKTLDPEIQQDISDFFMDAKQAYYDERASNMDDDDD